MIIAIKWVPKSLEGESSMKLIASPRLSAALFLTVGLLANGARANPVISGIINFDGVATTDTGNLATATAYTSIYDTYVFPGSTGAYTTVPLFSPATFTPFSFSAGSVLPLWTFSVGATTYSFSATSINIDTQNGKFLNLSGMGWANITGYQTTEGTWTITDTTTKGPVFTFGASTQALPDSGGTALLIGLGMAGIVAAMISRRPRLAKA